jgi:hypothetical protein
MIGRRRGEQEMNRANRMKNGGQAEGIRRFSKYFLGKVFTIPFVHESE